MTSNIRIVMPVLDDVLYPLSAKSDHLAICKEPKYARTNPLFGGTQLVGFRVYGLHCMHKHRNGYYCKRVAFNDYMYCDHHLKSDIGLSISRSAKLSGRGLGLYAEKEFHKGDQIDMYRGEIMTPEKRLYRYENPDDQSTERYTVEVLGSDNTVDALCAPCAASYSNDACNILELMKKSRTESEFELLYEAERPEGENAISYGPSKRHAPILTATRHIMPGDEILWKYGAPYWSNQRDLFIN
jgi:SET domain-containing protein